MTQEAVAEKLGIPRSAVSDIETGKRELSATELFRLTELFGESLDYLLGLKDEQPEEELVMLRAEEVSSAARAELNRFVHLCEEYRELEEMTGEVREAELRPVRTILSTYAQAWKLAEDERQRLDLGWPPAQQLLWALEERVGIKVFFLSLGDSVAGASIRSRRFGPAILVNRDNVPGRRVFTLAHEYFHLLTEGRVVGSKGPQALHVCAPKDTDGKKDRADVLADQFAGRLLMPTDILIEQLQSLVRKDRTVEGFDLIRLAQRFGVSTQAMLVQLAAGRIITWDAYKEIYTDPEFQDRIVKERGDERGPEPRRFRDLALKAYLSEEISRSRLAELLGENVADVDEEVDRYRGGKGGRDGIRLSLPR